MPRAYYSTVLDHSADTVWHAIRAFDHYSWAGTGIEAEMEHGRPGDAVGGVRRIGTAEPAVRQQLLAHSDRDRFYTYEFCDPAPFPVNAYQATLRVTPVTDGNRAFVEWYATFDCAIDERGYWIEHFQREGFATWLASLRAQLDRSPMQTPEQPRSIRTSTHL